MQEQLHAHLEDLFQKVFNDDTLILRDDLTAADIPEWDSMNHINLMFGIEEAFGVQFTGDQLAEFANIGELKDFLARHSSRYAARL
jgi:acyl carrier protein